MDDLQLMRRAVRLARRGEGYVEPNPMVGCVIVKNGRIVGEGWHRRFGGPHAEVEALRDAGEAARDATVYVTLEPCPHHGKTPPCSRALIDAGVKRVVIGAVDPHPDRAGVGVRQLETTGIPVSMSSLRQECLDLIEPFLKRSVLGLPYVIAKWAATVDGSIATASGDSRWISNELSRRRVHQLRGRVDAVLIGITTALADDPLLTARGVRPRRIARRIVIDPHLKLSTDAQLLQTIDRAPVLIATSEATVQARPAKLLEIEAAGAELVGLPDRTDGSGLDLLMLMRHLADQGTTNVLLEGGGRTIGAMADQQLLDELHVFLGPVLLGDGAGRRPVVMHTPPATIADAQALRLLQVRQLQGDVFLRYRFPGRRS